MNLVANVVLFLSTSLSAPPWWSLLELGTFSCMPGCGLE